MDKSAWLQQTFDQSEARFTSSEDDPYRIVESMAHSIDPSISSSTIQEATDQRIARFESILTDVPATTLSVLEALRLRSRGVNLALIFNTDSLEKKAWQRSPFSPLLETVVFSCDFLRCLSHLGLFRVFQKLVHKLQGTTAY